MQSRTSKVLALSMGQGLTALVSLGSGAVLARLLTQGELATYRQTLLAYNIAAPVLSLGLSFGLYYFLANEEQRARSVVVEGLLVMFLMGFIYAVFIAGGGNILLAHNFSNPEVEKTLLYLIPYPLLILPTGLLSAVLVVRNKVRQLTIYNVISNLVLGCSVIASCIIWENPKDLIITYVAVSMVSGVVAIVLMLRAVPNGACSPKWKHVKTMIAYSLPLALASMLGSIALQMDKFIISSMRTPEEFAIYSIGAVEIPVVGIITGAISSVILADMAIYCKTGDKGQALALFKKGAVCSALILFPVTAFLMTFADEFITLLFSDKYQGSVGVFRVYLGILPVRIVVYGAALMALNMTRVILFRSAMDLTINLFLSLVLVYYWGPYGAALATIIMLYAWCIPYNLCMIGKGFGCRWYATLPFRNLLKIMVFSVTGGVVCVLLKVCLSGLAPILLFVLGFAIFTTVYLVLCIKYVEGLRGLVSGVFKNASHLGTLQ